MSTVTGKYGQLNILNPGVSKTQVYPLQPGDCCIGSSVLSQIRLIRPDVEPQHCIVTIHNNRLATIMSKSIFSPMSLNNKKLHRKKSEVLRPGDIMELGGIRIAYENSTLSDQEIAARKSSVLKPLTRFFRTPGRTTSNINTPKRSVFKSIVSPMSAKRSSKENVKHLWSSDVIMSTDFPSRSSDGSFDSVKSKELPTYNPPEIPSQQQKAALNKSARPVTSRIPVLSKYPSQSSTDTDEPVEVINLVSPKASHSLAPTNVYKTQEDSSFIVVTKTPKSAKKAQTPASLGSKLPKSILKSSKSSRKRLSALKENETVQSLKSRRSIMPGASPYDGTQSRKSNEVVTFQHSSSTPPFFLASCSARKSDRLSSVSIPSFMDDEDIGEPYNRSKLGLSGLNVSQNLSTDVSPHKTRKSSYLLNKSNEETDDDETDMNTSHCLSSPSNSFVFVKSSGHPEASHMQSIFEKDLSPIKETTHSDLMHLNNAPDKDSSFNVSGVTALSNSPDQQRNSFRRSFRKSKHNESVLTVCSDSMDVTATTNNVPDDVTDINTEDNDSNESDTAIANNGPNDVTVTGSITAEYDSNESDVEVNDECYESSIVVSDSDEEDIGINRSTSVKSTTPQKDVSNISGARKMLKNRNTSKNYQSRTSTVKRLRRKSSQVRSRMKTPSIQNSPANDLRDVRGVKKLMKTPKVQYSPANNLSDMRGVKKLMATPRLHNSPANSLLDVEGMQDLFKTPKLQPSHLNDLKEMRFGKTPRSGPCPLSDTKSNLSEVGRRLTSTPKPQHSPANEMPRAQSFPDNDLSFNISVRKSMKTPKKLPKTSTMQRSPMNELTDVEHVKELTETHSLENDSSHIESVKKLMKTSTRASKTPEVQYSPMNGVSEVDRAKNLVGTQVSQENGSNYVESFKTPMKTPKRLTETPTMQHSPMNDLTDIEGVKELMETPTIQRSLLNYSSCIESVKKQMKTPKRVSKTPKIHYSSMNDPTEVEGAKNLMETPITQENYSNYVEGFKTPRKTPKRLTKTPEVQHSPMNDLTNVTGINELMETPRAELLEVKISSDVEGRRRSKRTPKPKYSPSYVVSLRRLTKTPKVQHSPMNNSTGVEGVKSLIETPVTKVSQKNDLNYVEGFKTPMKTPKRLTETPTMQHSPMNDLTDIEGVKELMETPTIQRSLLNYSSCIESVKKQMKTPKRVSKTPKIHYSSMNDPTEVEGSKNLMETPITQENYVEGFKTPRKTPKRLTKTPEVQHSPMNDLTNVTGINELMETPRAELLEVKISSDVEGRRRSKRTPKPKYSPSYVVSLRRLTKTPKVANSPMNDLANVNVVKELIETPTIQSSLQNYSSRIESVEKPLKTPKRLSKTPKVQHSPMNNSTGVEGVKSLIETPVTKVSQKNDSNYVEGFKTPMKTPKRFAKTPVLPHSSKMGTRTSKTPMTTPKVEHVSIIDSTGVEELQQTPRMELSSEHDSSLIDGSKRGRRSSKTPMKTPKIQQVPTSNSTDTEELQETPRIELPSEHDSDQVEGNKRGRKTSKTPMKTPKAQQVRKNDSTDVEELQETPRIELTSEHDSGQVECSKTRSRASKTPVKTPKVQVPMNSSTHLEGVKELLETPRMELPSEHDFSHLQSSIRGRTSKTPMKTPKVQQGSMNNSVELSAEELMETTGTQLHLENDLNDLANVNVVKELIETPTIQSSLQNYSSRIESVEKPLKTPKRLSKTPKVQHSPMNNSTGVEGVKSLIETPVTKVSQQNDSNYVEGFKTPMKTPKRFAKTPVLPHSSKMGTKTSKTPMTTPKVEHVSIIDSTGVEELQQTPRMELSSEHDSSLIDGSKRGRRSSKTPMKTPKIQQVPTSNSTDTEELQETPRIELPSEHDSDQVEGNKRGRKTSKTPMKTPKAQQVRKNDSTDVGELQETPRIELTSEHDSGQVECSKTRSRASKTPVKTPKVQVPMNSSTHLEGVKELLETPRMELPSEHDFSHLQSSIRGRTSKTPMKTPKVQQGSMNNSVELSAEELTETTGTQLHLENDLNDLANVNVVKELIETPTIQSSLQNYSSRIESVEKPLKTPKRLSKTPKVQHSPMNNSTGVEGVKSPIETPVTKVSQKNVSNYVEGFKTPMKTPKRFAKTPVLPHSSKMGTRTSKTPMTTPKVEHVSIIDSTGVEELQQTPRMELSSEHDSSLIDGSKRGRRSSKTPMKTPKIQQVPTSNSTDTEELQETPRIELPSEHDSDQVEGNKRGRKTSKTPMKTPKAQQVRKNDSTDVGELQETPRIELTSEHDSGQVECSKTRSRASKTPVKTPKVQVPMNSSTHLEGVKELLETPRMELPSEHDFSHLQSSIRGRTSKTPMKTPKVQQGSMNNSVELSAEELMETTGTQLHLENDLNDLANVNVVKELIETPTIQSSLQNYSSRIESVEKPLKTPKRLSKTPKVQHSPMNNSTGVEGVKSLIETPVTKVSQKNVSNYVEGFKTPMKTPKRFAKTPVLPHSSKMGTRTSKTPMTTPKVEHVSIIDSTGVEELQQTPRMELSSEHDSSLIDDSKRGRRSSKTPMKTPKIQQVPTSNSTDTEELQETPRIELPSEHDSDQVEGNKRGRKTSKTPMKTPKAQQVRKNDSTDVGELQETPRIELTSEHDSGQVECSKTRSRASKTPVKTPKVQVPMNSSTHLEGVKELLETPRMELPFSHLQSSIRGRTSKTPMKTPKDLIGVEGVKGLTETSIIELSTEELMETTGTQLHPENDLNNVENKRLRRRQKLQNSPANELRGLKNLLKTPKSPKNDLTDVGGVKKLLLSPRIHNSPLNDLRDVRGVKQLLKTPRPQRSPKNTLEHVSGVSKLLKTPKLRKPPKNDLTNISLGTLFEEAEIQPPKKKPSDGDYTDVVGVKRLFAEEEAAYKREFNVSGVADIFQASSSEAFDMLLNKRPVRTYRGKSSSPTKLNRLTVLRKGVGASPTISPDVAEWVEKQSTYGTSDDEEAANIPEKSQNISSLKAVSTRLQTPEIVKVSKSKRQRNIAVSANSTDVSALFTKPLSNGSENIIHSSDNILKDVQNQLLSSVKAVQCAMKTSTPNKKNIEENVTPHLTSHANVPAEKDNLRSSKRTHRKPARISDGFVSDLSGISMISRKSPVKKAPQQNTFENAEQVLEAAAKPEVKKTSKKVGTKIETPQEDQVVEQRPKRRRVLKKNEESLPSEDESKMKDIPKRRIKKDASEMTEEASTLSTTDNSKRQRATRKRAARQEPEMPEDDSDELIETSKPVTKRQTRAAKKDNQSIDLADNTTKRTLKRKAAKVENESNDQTSSSNADEPAVPQRTTRIRTARKMKEDAPVEPKTTKENKAVENELVTRQTNRTRGANKANENDNTNAREPAVTQRTTRKHAARKMEENKVEPKTTNENKAVETEMVTRQTNHTRDAKKASVKDNTKADEPTVTQRTTRKHIARKIKEEVPVESKTTDENKADKNEMVTRQTRGANKANENNNSNAHEHTVTQRTTRKHTGRKIEEETSVESKLKENKAVESEIVTRQTRGANKANENNNSNAHEHAVTQRTTRKHTGRKIEEETSVESKLKENKAVESEIVTRQTRGANKANEKDDINANEPAVTQRTTRKRTARKMEEESPVEPKTIKESKVVENEMVARQTNRTRGAKKAKLEIVPDVKEGIEEMAKIDKQTTGKEVTKKVTFKSPIEDVKLLRVTRRGAIQKIKQVAEAPIRQSARRRR